MYPLAHLHNRPLIDAGSVIGAQELNQLVSLDFSAVVFHGDMPGVQIGHHAVALRQDHDFGVHADFMLHTGAHDGGFRTQQGHCLTLHIGAHQSTVCVVVGQEGNHCGSD